jgi:spoIIIJ-associated protein
MVREFEGATEKEAIERAIAELNLNREQFDVEIIEEEKKGLFRKGSVRIKVYLKDREGMDSESPADSAGEPNFNKIEYHDPSGHIKTDRAPIHPLDPNEDELKIIQFLTETVKLMGYDAVVNVVKKEDRKVVLDIDSQNSGILIGRKGKNLDAIQLLANVYAGRLPSNMKIVVDAENYRVRREENLIRLATRTADQVRKSRSSRLLEPMNPFERRLIHTTLNPIDDIDTKSEGDGLYKQVRVLFKGK